MQSFVRFACGFCQLSSEDSLTTEIGVLFPGQDAFYLNDAIYFECKLLTKKIIATQCVVKNCFDFHVIQTVFFSFNLVLSYE